MKVLEPKMYEALTTFPYSAEIMLHVESRMKKTLVECGAGFPVLLLYGAPANGKTSTARACLTEEDRTVKFAEGLKTVKESITEELKDNVILLDNYPRFLSSYKREKALTILDYVIDIASEKTDIPAVMMTAEPEILSELKRAQSMFDRVVLVPVSKIDDDEKLNSIRDYLTLNRHEYLDLMENFQIWFDKNCENEEVVNKLRGFRYQHREYSARFTGLVFAYYYACEVFSKFLHSEYEICLDDAIIRRNVDQLFKWKEGAIKKQASIVVNVWRELLNNENAFEVFKPEANVCKYLINKDICEGDYYNNYNNGYDDDYDDGYDDDYDNGYGYGYDNGSGYDHENRTYNCNRCNSRDDVQYYNPVDITIRRGDKLSVTLIEDPLLIKGFPKHIGYKDPLLIIENTTLCSLMNCCLENYARKNNISCRSFSPKKLNKELYLNNLCLFEYVGENHNTYTFGLHDTKGKKVRVLMMKLTEEQYERLNERSVYLQSAFDRTYEWRTVLEAKRDVSEICSNIQNLFGKIGEPSKIICE